MDKTILKKFAIESRQDLMSKIETKIKTFYVDEDFEKEQKGELYLLTNERHSLSLTKEQNEKRDLLIKRINELTLDGVIEESAYTWFNRIIAIRYMEINDMLPIAKDNSSLGIRVLSSKDNTPDPEILKFTNLINSELDINFKKEKYAELKDDNEKFRYILLLVCKKLGKIIPQVFDGTTDYIDILMPDNLLNEAGFITKVINDVPENNYDQVEIIGWLYQYYNQTEKDRVISARKAYKKNEIPYATQLFTPDWIVKYMVENSLGRYWIEHSEEEILYPSNNLYPSDNLYPSSSIIDNWKYFIKDNIKKQSDNINPRDITFIDPCCGSGHILVYAFEVLYQIYLSSGYNKNEIPELILKNNLYGLDIDDRAGQLSILSVLLKAREYDKNIFNKDIVKNLNIMSIQESKNVDNFTIQSLPSNLSEKVQYLKDLFKNAKEIGSLLIVETKNYDDLLQYINNEITMDTLNLKNYLIPLIKQTNILSKKYDIVVTNPPYMNSGVMPITLKNYVSKYYNSAKTDLYACFMKIKLLNKNSYLAMINQHGWMFLNSFEELRKEILNSMNISTMIHLGTRAFEDIGGEIVQTTTFVIQNNNKNIIGNYYRLVNISNARRKEEDFLKIINNFMRVNQTDFFKMPNYIIGYWMPDKLKDIFKEKETFDNIATAKSGIMTGDDGKFIKQWYEVISDKIDVSNKNYDEYIKNNKKWFFCTRGGTYRKWYGNIENIINLENDAFEIKNNGKNFRLREHKYYFKKGLTWTMITTKDLSIRFVPDGIIFGNGGPTVFVDKNLEYYIALLNSKIINKMISFMNPTMNIVIDDINKLPVIVLEKEKVEKISNENINISKKDWDSFETSWDFKEHPLIEYKSGAGYENNLSKWNYKISDAFESWESNSLENFNLLKKNEEELNKIFIDIYGLQDELTPEVLDKDVTIRKADRVRDIKSLISYAVGCMFGRYSLDKEGLIYAGGEFDLSKYKMFESDIDNIIPITDEAYFNDDIVSRFKLFIEKVYGKETLNENLDYIAETLGKKGTETSEDTIRRYFVNDFYDDHIKTYQKRPIYWLFDSGKKNGFKCLIYMHRYSKDLVATIRTKYIPKLQTTYEKLLSDVEYRLTTELSLNDKKDMEKKKIELNGKLQEVREYYEKVANVANRMIDIDLDDGVVTNYAKFTYLNPKTNIEESILGKIK